jgi:hypothetical protein
VASPRGLLPRLPNEPSGVGASNVDSRRAQPAEPSVMAATRGR